jgi:hypothetical protein
MKEVSTRLFQKKALPGDIAVLASNYPTNRMNLQPGGKQLVMNSMRGDEIGSGNHELVNCPKQEKLKIMFQERSLWSEHLGF